jgi:hypothetical protein
MSEVCCKLDGTDYVSVARDHTDLSVSPVKVGTLSIRIDVMEYGGVLGRTIDTDNDRVPHHATSVDN